jgi:phospholipid/cholesterol/gamma-HCH transport system substrate-binding protein
MMNGCQNNNFKYLIELLKRNNNMVIKKDKILEFSFGILTLFAIFILCVFFLNNSYFSSLRSKKDSDYKTYYAAFDDIDGVYDGSDVKLAGVNVGKLEKIFINENFQAVAKIKILKNYKISQDAMLIVGTSGFLGSKYLKILPGYKEEYLGQDDYFQFTQSSVGLESLLSLFNKK